MSEKPNVLNVRWVFRVTHNVPAKCRARSSRKWHGHLALVVARFVIFFSRTTKAERLFSPFRFSMINLPLNIWLGKLGQLLRLDLQKNWKASSSFLTARILSRIWWQVQCVNSKSHFWENHFLIRLTNPKLSTKHLCLITRFSVEFICKNDC